MSAISREIDESIRFENEILKQRLEEAEATLEAIRNGEVDALVVTGSAGEHIFSLRGAEQPYRVFVETMHEGAATIDEDGCILYCNQRFSDLTNRPLNKIISSSIFEFIAQEDKAVLLATLSRASHQSAQAEVNLASGAKAVPVMISASRLLDVDEPFLAVTITDLTDQKRSEEMVASERLARSILDNATEAIVVCDPSGRILRANAAARLLAGGECLHCQFSEIFDLSTDLREDLLETAFKGESVRSIEARLRTNGVIRELLVSSGALGPESGLDLGCVISMTDVTERNEATRQIKEMNDSLEKKIDERTKQLVAANKELEGFCYSVSHDLRAPLRSMVASSMILKEDFPNDLPNGVSYELERLAANSNKMATLIDDLLRFSRLGRQEMKFQETDFSALADNVVREFNIPREEIEFVIEPNVMAWADPLLLKMAMENLIGNAVKFTANRPGARIEIGKEVIDGEDVFFVRDNGVGFDMLYVEKIFRPFERLHLDSQYPGTGIGLANVHRIISRHGGAIWADSKLDEGTTLSFTLPRGAYAI